MTSKIFPNWSAIRRQLVYETLQRAAMHGRDTLTREEQKRIDRAMTRLQQAYFINGELPNEALSSSAENNSLGPAA
jgi:hypothetical protein